MKAAAQASQRKLDARKLKIEKREVEGVTAGLSQTDSVDTGHQLETARSRLQVGHDAAVV